MNVMNAVFARVNVRNCGGSCRLVVLLAQTSARKLRRRCRDEMFAYETDEVPKKLQVSRLTSMKVMKAAALLNGLLHSR